MKPIVVNFHMYISVSNVYFLLLQNNTDAGKNLFYRVPQW